MARSMATIMKALAGDLEFHDLRLVEAHVKQAIRSGPLPTNAQIGAMIQAQRLEKDGGNLVRFLPVLSLDSRYDDNSAKDGVSIMVRYQVTYKATSLRHAKDEALSEFGAKEVLPMVWPYWQAFVSDMLGRMNLPFLRIEPFSKATLTRGEPPPELQALGIPTTPKRKAKRARKKSRKRPA
jgi:hypothetical protein